jgi:hypothetical protein
MITYLKAFSYSVVRLPRADIRPLHLLARSGPSLNRIGAVTTVFDAGEAKLPEVGSGPAANISGKRTGALNVGVGLSVLANVIAAMGGSGLGLDVQYRQARTATFEFLDVVEDRIEVAALDQFLATADVNPHSRHVATLLEADDLYVTTATIKSRKFAVESKTSHGAGVELSIPEIQQLVGAEVTVSGEAATTAKVTYEGRTPLVFGFQAVRLFYEDGRYTAFEPLEPARKGMGALESAPADGAVRLVTDGPFVALGST